VGGARIFERGATTHTQKWQTLTTMDAAAAACAAAACAAAACAAAAYTL
jgi:hypothetical protein